MLIYLIDTPQGRERIPPVPQSSDSTLPYYAGLSASGICQLSISQGSVIQLWPMLSGGEPVPYHIAPALYSSKHYRLIHEAQLVPHPLQDPVLLKNISQMNLHFLFVRYYLVRPFQYCQPF